MRHFSILLTLGSLAVSPVFMPTALAQDDDEWLDDFDEDEEDNDELERESEGDSEIEMDEEVEEIDEDDLDDDPVDDEDFLDEESDIEADEIGGEGVDNAKLYRATMNRVREMGYEEELINWERYLERYPNTLFRQHINERMEALTSEAYGERIEGLDTRIVDAGRAELDFTAGMQLESIDPRSRLRAGFQMGLPGYITFLADYEKQILRELSAHVGVQGRYTGPAAIAGAKYALIKSARTHTLLTGVVDLMLNSLHDDAYASIRPILGYGQRLDVAEGLDLQVQFGAEFEAPHGPKPTSRVIYTGGLNAFVRIDERVGAFIETSTNMKKGVDAPGSSNRPFAFNVITIGMRFQPGEDDKTRFVTNTNMGYRENYWGHYKGALQGEYRYLLD